MNYQPYFNLALFHNYYQNQICPDFTIEPTNDCQQILKGYRLIIKPNINGLQLLIPVGPDQQPVLPLDKSLFFTFLLKLKNPNFFTFTQLDSEYYPNSSFYVSSSESLSQNDTEPLSLGATLIQRQKIVQPESKPSPLEARCAAIAELHEAPLGQVFGVIEIRPHDFPKGESRNRNFKITFAAKEQVWKYYLITAKTDESLGKTSFSIQDKNKNFPIRFSPFKADSSDRILAKIQQRFPESQTVLLRSDAPVACREIGRRDLQLFKKVLDKQKGKEEEKLWIANLPNPPNQHGIQVINMLQGV